MQSGQSQLPQRRLAKSKINQFTKPGNTRTTDKDECRRTAATDDSVVYEDFVAEMHRKHWTMNKKRPLFTLDGCHASALLPGDAWSVGDRIVLTFFLEKADGRHFASSSSLVPNGVHPPAGHLFGGPLAPL